MLRLPFPSIAEVDCIVGVWGRVPLYAAFNKRETEVTLLASRAGVPSWGPEMPDHPDVDVPISLTYADFQQAAAMLREVDHPIERSDEEAWPHFRGWRANYDATALLLAKRLDAPPALWTGPRRWPPTPIAPSRPRQ